MDSFASDRKLSELGELDLQDLLDQSDLFDDDDDGRRQLTRRRRRHDTDNADCVSSPVLHVEFINVQFAGEIDGILAHGFFTPFSIL